MLIIAKPLYDVKQYHLLYFLFPLFINIENTPLKRNPSFPNSLALPIKKDISL